MRKMRNITASAAIVSLLVTAGCSQKYAAERDGKDLGEAICDLYGADSQEDADAALDEINEQLDDLGNKYAVYTAEDRADIDNNVADLAEHTLQEQPGLAQQDLTVLERSANNIAEDVNETSQAAWDGLLEGLADCTQ